MHLTDAELLALIQKYFWTFARTGGVLMAAPLLSNAPRRVRLIFAVMLSVVLAPLLPQAPALELFSASWTLGLVQQLAIGIAMGFVLTLVFEAVVLGGELVAYGMGLSFAQVADPVNHSEVPLPGQFLMIMAMLLFLSMNGHLALIELLAHSFTSLPPGQGGLGAQDFYAIVRFAGEIFSGGMRVALPAVIALLLVNLAFGVISRAAPALNVQSIGFPLSLVAGLWLLDLTLEPLQIVFTSVLAHGWQFLAALLSHAHG